ncbi:MAG: 3'-5' exonuclease [Candidatus Cyclobacteriaceae bacterium M3_2C_046]
MFPKKINKEELNELPLKGFEGKIILVVKPDQLASALSEIRQQSAVGIDTERKPSFVKGQKHEVSILQVALPEKVFVIRLNYTGISPELKAFFSDPDLLKVGIGLADDLQSLLQLTDFIPGGFLDLNEFTRQLGVENVGARNLAGIFLGFRISKKQQTSNWEQSKLTDKQLKYAATDAWICLEIFQKLDYWGYYR